MILFLAVGDIMLSAHRKTGQMIKRNGPEYPFEKIKSTLLQADLLFGNLECPLSDRRVPHSVKGPHLTFLAVPYSVKGLKSAGFHVLSLANNHILDYGKPALLDTMNSLEQAGIKSTGVYAKSLHPGYAVLQKNGIKVAFIGYNSLPNPKINLKGKSILRIKQLNQKNIHTDIQHVKRRFSPDFIINSVHWGASYWKYPIPFQMEFAREMIDCGADIVLGHHPHVIQGVEKYKNGIIVYSLGDFVFDEPYPDTKESFIFSCRLSHEGFHDVEYIPVVLNETYQPVLARGTRKEEIKKKISWLSEEYKSRAWLHNPSKNPTAASFLRSVKEGFINKNFMTCMNVYPFRFLLVYALPILIFGIFKKTSCFLKQTLNK